MTELYELEEFELTADAPEECEEPDTFTPDTAEKVDWVLSKIADHRARAARIRANAELLAKAEDRAADAMLWRYNAPLQAFAKAQTEGTGKKSWRGLHGVIGWRTRPAGIDFDPDTVKAWAFTAATDCLRVDKAALNKRLTVSETGQVVDSSTGEVLAFATATPAEETFFVK